MPSKYMWFLLQLASVVAAALLAGSIPLAHAELSDPPPAQKIAGLPIGILREALSNPDPATRQRLFTLVAQRVARNAATRQRLLAIDSSEAASRLAQFEFSAEMLSAAKEQTSDPAVRDKLTQVVAVIIQLQTAAP